MGIKITDTTLRTLINLYSYPYEHKDAQLLRP